MRGARDRARPAVLAAVHRTASATRCSRSQIPLIDRGVFHGALIAEYSVERLLRYFVPTEVVAPPRDHRCSTRSERVARQHGDDRCRARPQAGRRSCFELPVAPAENGLVLRGQGYRTSIGLIGNTPVLDGRCCCRRSPSGCCSAPGATCAGGCRCRAALVSETNFRRAMENSMLTGMRAMDMEGRISYVNPAFCAMTGFSEADLIGQHAALPVLAARPHRRERAPARAGAAGPQPGRRHRGQGDAQGRHRCSTPACTSRR